MSISGREFGFYERYSLSRTLVKYPPIISYLAVLTSAPLHSTVQDIITHLLLQYPLLACSIPSPHTPHPHYSHNPSLRAKDVFRTAHSDASHADILRTELNAASEEFDVCTGPLWRVTLYIGAAAPRLVVTLNHTLSDGVGGRNLFGQLLSLLQSSIKSTGSATTLPPTLESTVDVRPGYLYLVRTVLSELVFPRLPSFLAPPKPSMWPNPTPIVPKTGQIQITALSVLAEWIPRLKAAGAGRGVKTLHPLLHTCALAALSAAVNGKEVNVVFNSPISLRSLALGHPHATGNYVGNHSAEYSRLSPNTSFWEETISFAQSLVDPVKRAAARGAIGMLQYVPNPEQMPGLDKSGWEVWMEQKINSNYAYRASVEVSNLGVIQEELKGVGEVLFAQIPGAAGAALTMNLIASKGGPLGITVSFREGVLQPELVDKFYARFKANVEALAKNAIAEDATFSDLC